MESSDASYPESPIDPIESGEQLDEHAVAHFNDGREPGYESSDIVPDQIAEEIAAEPERPSLQERLDELLADPQSAGVNIAENHIVILDDVVVRSYPAPHHLQVRGIQGSNPLTLEDAQQRVDAIPAHHRILAGGEAGDEPGVTIPETYYKVLPAPDGKATIASMSERIHGEPITYDPWQNRVLDAEQEASAAQLAESVIRYYGWVVETIPDTFLSDVATPNQYFIAEDGALALVDTDPMFRPLTTRNGWSYLGNNIEQIRAWVGKLTPEGSEEQVATLLEKINVVRDRCAELRRSYIYTLPEN